MSEKQKPSAASTSAAHFRRAPSDRSEHNSVEMTVPESFCLRWNNYQSNLTTGFEQLLQSEQFVDVTLFSEGFTIKAHKMVLSACSPYFQTMLNGNPCQHPIIFLKDVKFSILKAIVEFMYRGEINVCQDQITPLLRIAEQLKIRGLADVQPDSNTESGESNETVRVTTLQSSGKRVLPNVNLDADIGNFCEPQNKRQKNVAHDETPNDGNGDKSTSTFNTTVVEVKEEEGLTVDEPALNIDEERVSTPLFIFGKLFFVFLFFLTNLLNMFFYYKCSIMFLFQFRIFLKIKFMC